MVPEAPGWPKLMLDASISSFTGLVEDPTSALVSRSSGSKPVQNSVQKRELCGCFSVHFEDGVMPEVSASIAPFWNRASTPDDSGGFQGGRTEAGAPMSQEMTATKKHVYFCLVVVHLVSGCGCFYGRNTQSGWTWCVRNKKRSKYKEHFLLHTQRCSACFSEARALQKHLAHQKGPHTHPRACNTGSGRPAGTEPIPTNVGGAPPPPAASGSPKTRRGVFLCLFVWKTGLYQRQNLQH